MKDTALVVGASGGIGAAIAGALEASGRRVVRWARQRTPGQDVAADVRDPAAVTNAAGAVLAATGDRLDLLVYAAGNLTLGAVEELAPAELDELLSVHVRGLHLVVRQLLPALRRSPRAALVIVGSVGGRVATPLFGGYNAAKFAQAGLVEALDAELRPQGVPCALVEPGGVATDLIRRARWAEERPEYRKIRARLGEILATGRAHTTPSEVAEAVVQALSASRLPLVVRVGPEARRWAWLRRLPDSWYHRVREVDLARLGLRGGPGSPGR